MITINYNGKTYIPGNGNLFSMDNIIKYAIADGNLQEKAEEVKENKEDVLSVKQENPHDKIKIVTPRGETIHINYDFMPSDTSILEKLREELERRINSEEWSTPYMEVKWELEEVLDFVNSLETKENKEPTWVDDLQGISKLIEEDVKKEQFTPGQEIELLPAYEPLEPDWRDMQISLLTTAVNQLINK